MNKQETAIVLRILRTVWPNEQISEDRITAYQWAFEDLEYKTVEDAVKRWMKTGKFFPKPAEILDIIGTEQVGSDLIPETAWAEVMKEASRKGLNGRREFSHPLIEQAVESVGWYEICMTDYSKHPTLRAQFREALKALQAREIQKVQLGGRPDSLTPLPKGDANRPTDGPALPDASLRQLDREAS